MRRLLTSDHDLLGEEPPRNDLVLGAPALLGIFFAVAVICALCFGFGYSSGHIVRRSAQQPRVVAPPVQRPEPVAEAPQGTASIDSEATGGELPGFPPDTSGKPARSKPAPGVELTAPAEDTAGAPVPLRPEASELPRSAAPAPASARANLAAASRLPSNAGATTSAPDSMRATGPGAMVQIAAVTHAADAEALAVSLRRDGFAATVRTSTADDFFHVQIGPFPSLEAAKAVRTRLVNSGYNAFIKP